MADFTIRFKNGGLSPGKVPAGDLADVISSVEDMVLAEVKQQEESTAEDELVIGLVSLSTESIGLSFTASHPDSVLPSFGKIVECVRSKNYGALAPATIKPLRKVSSFTRKYNCTAELKIENGQAEPGAIMTPQDEIGEAPSMAAETTIYGEIMRVGGKEPRVMVGTIAGDVVFCAVGKDLARELGKKLYSSVGLTGDARWDALTGEMVEFKITGIAAYDGGAISTVMGQLSEAIGKYYKGVGNVPEYVAKIRGQTVEE